MKKTVFFAVLTAAVILLSGCDAMLEVFYPEFKDNYDSNNVLTVEYNLNYYTLDQLNNLGYNNQLPMKLQIYESGTGDPTNGTGLVDSVDVYGEASYWFDFYLNSGSYDVWVWQDANENGFLENGEFSLFEGNVFYHTFYFNTSSGQYIYFYGDDWDTYY